MNLLAEKFEKIYARYQKRRDFFKEIIDGFKSSRGKKDLASKGVELLAEGDKMGQSLKKIFTQDVAGLDKRKLKRDIREFNNVYKALVELTKPIWRQWTEAIVVALVLAFLLRNFLFGLYHVPTGSAEKNILVGDRIWGNKMAYYFAPVKHGDLVIFDRPDFVYDRESTINYYWQKYIGIPIPLLGLTTGPENWVKRVIACEGDIIEGRVEDGKTVIYLNGKKLEEPYVNPYPLIVLQKTIGFIDADYFGPLRIPQFLRYRTTEVHYTYDPEKPYDKQPYYYIEESEVARHPLTGHPLLIRPFTPSYDVDMFMDHHCRDTFGPFTVPKGAYWVMGDSRKNSRDSRWWQFLPRELIHGRASFVIYSVDSEEAFWLFDLIKHPIDFWRKHVRYNRFFKKLHNGDCARQIPVEGK